MVQWLGRYRGGVFWQGEGLRPKNASELTDALNKKYRVNLHRFYEVLQLSSSKF